MDCAPALPPSSRSRAELVCVGRGRPKEKPPSPTTDPTSLKVKAKVGGKTPARPALRVGPGATETGTVDLSQYEDQTITVRHPRGRRYGRGNTPSRRTASRRGPVPAVSVAGQRCPPPSTTVTLSNNGDPDSQVVFVIRVDGTVVQGSPPRCTEATPPRWSPISRGTRTRP